MGKRIVIIGGVAAGPKAASRIKRVLPEADVTLIDGSSYRAHESEREALERRKRRPPHLGATLLSSQSVTSTTPTSHRP